MTAQQYSLIIWLACIIAWIIVWLPAVVHLSVGWRKGSHGLFELLGPNEVVLYYKQFLPTHELPETNAKKCKEFEAHFAQRYGRRLYILPLSVLIAVSGIGFWSVAKSLEVSEKLAVATFALRYTALSAFMGAFVWVAFDQFSRLRNRDLTYHDICSGVFRFLIAVPFGFAFQATVNPSLAVPMAFFLGVFPTGTIFTFARRFAVREMKLGEASGETANELEKLQCVSRSAAERFMDEGINTIAELAWSDPVDVTLRTNKSFDYIIDCCSQALVWVYFTDQTKELYKFSLRSAHDVTSLIYALSDANEHMRQSAEETLTRAAMALGMSASTLEHTLRQIATDPFTQFMVDIWHWPTKPVNMIPLLPRPIVAAPIAQPATASPQAPSSGDTPQGQGSVDVN